MPEAIITRSPRFGVGALAMLLALGATDLEGQDAAALRMQCDIVQLRAQTDLELDAYWAPRHPDSIFVRLAPTMAQRDWGGVMDSLRIVAAVHRNSGHLEATEYARFDAELAAAGVLLREEARNTANAGTNAASATIWHPVGDPDQPRYDIFAGRPGALSVTDAMPLPRMRALCWTALATERLLTLFNTAARVRVEQELGRIDALWDRFAERGYAQLPWELVLNALTTMRTGSLEPPRRQWVLLHPEPAVQISGGRYPDWRSSDALSVSLLGMLFYDASRSSHRGLAATLIASANEPLGYGLTVVLSRGVSIGYVRRNTATATAKNGLMVSADVYQFLTGIPEKIAGLKKEALQTVARKELPGGADPR